MPSCRQQRSVLRNLSSLGLQTEQQTHQVVTHPPQCLALPSQHSHDALPIGLASLSRPTGPFTPPSRLTAGSSATWSNFSAATGRSATAAGALLGSDPPSGLEEIDHALWQSCHRGQRRTAKYLYARGAEINALPDHSQHVPLS
jgi:hypothetical protein